MRRTDHTHARDALAQYLAARVPTSTLTQTLAGTIAQVLANDMSSDVTVLIGSTILMRRSPIPTR
jgi:hypothetical protein